MNAKDKKILRENPCTPDCPDRRGGCAIGCQRRAEFVAGRQQIYAERKAISERCCKTAGRRECDRKRARYKQRHHKSLRS